MTFPKIGVVGGGQLARMMAPAAEALGVSFHVLSEADGASAAQVSANVTVGDYRDWDTLEAFARTVDVLTFDHEHVPPEHLRALGAAGHSVHPGPDALIHAQDKLVMRKRIDELGLPNPRWAEVASVADLEVAAQDLGLPLILKTPRGGYDGHGVRVIHDPAEAADWFADAPGPLLAEEKVDFTRELAVMVGRSPSGQTAVWPVVATYQQDGVCKEAIAPAPGLAPELSARIQGDVIALATKLGVTGVMAMEMFEVPGGYLVNELAMRPHNTGHWTQDGSVTSQFEQHLRAVLDLPLGDPTATAPLTAMVNVLGADRDDLYHAYLHVLAHDPAVKVHMYGKGVRPGRKLGHVNLAGTDSAERLLARARHAADFIAGVDTNPHPDFGPEGETDTGGTASAAAGAAASAAGTSVSSTAAAGTGSVSTASAAGSQAQPRVGIVMGSDSDWPTMSAAADSLREFGIPFTAEVVSAHRMPEEMVEWGRTAADRGLEVIIAGAGGAAHLPGMLASLTSLPVIGVPVPLKYLDGMDSLLSIVQMPSGVPVATVSVGGAANAGLLAVRILAAGGTGDREAHANGAQAGEDDTPAGGNDTPAAADLRAALDEHRAALRDTAQAKGRALAERLAAGDTARD
ncbi:5-(carboxyamino)imidazole ribonucleotide synthase [Brevibacterium yomogidense]|uniref:5-(carboxyamino)imidazole ribonucleotide synthase n=1 Tax=Brevibacterium yomogidense TaxID=946573 RepID=UPI0018DF872F